MDKNSFTYIDLFSGIGGFKIALDKRGGKSIGFSEVDKNAIQAYCDNFQESEVNNFGDIKKIKNLPPHDLLTAGVPCQSWSSAGKNLGFKDARGRLWGDTLTLLRLSKPKAFIFENVKGLADPRHREALLSIMTHIKASGYYANYYLLNAKDYGVPQNRMRLYIIGFRSQSQLDKFKTPTPTPCKSVGNFLGLLPNRGGGVDGFFSLNDLRNGNRTLHSWDLTATTERQKEICLLILKNRRKKIYGNLDGNPLSLKDLRHLDPTITSRDLLELTVLHILKVSGDYWRGSRFEFKNTKMSTGLEGVNRIIMLGAKFFPTLTASDSNDFIALDHLDDLGGDCRSDFVERIYKPKKYRKITKEEALLLQGFPSQFLLPESRAKWMKLVGNSVAVPVIEALHRSIVETGVFGGKNETDD